MPTRRWADAKKTETALCLPWESEKLYEVLYSFEMEV